MGFSGHQCGYGFGCNNQFFGFCGECTPFSCYPNVGWVSGQCVNNFCGGCGGCGGCGCYTQNFTTCYPSGNPFWSFGCGGCNTCGKKKKDCKVKVITRDRM